VLAARRLLPVPSERQASGKQDALADEKPTKLIKRQGSRSSRSSAARDSLWGEPLGASRAAESASTGRSSRGNSGQTSANSNAPLLLANKSLTVSFGGPSCAPRGPVCLGRAADVQPPLWATRGDWKGRPDGAPEWVAQSGELASRAPGRRACQSLSV